jgi:nucleotide-binding universal stress UspA family protein
MTTVLAAVDEPVAAAAVLTASNALAHVFDAQVETLDARAHEGLLDRARRDDVVAVACGPQACDLADDLDKPVLVVPAHSKPASEIHTVVIAMEGSMTRARHLKRAVDLAQASDLDVIVVHVDDESSIPSFSDQVAHEAEEYATEFLARYVHGVPSARLELRVGAPADEIIDVTASTHADVVALGWPHRAPGRGEVVREVLDHSPVPVLLVALQDGGG